LYTGLRNHLSPVSADALSGARLFPLQSPPFVKSGHKKTGAKYLVIFRQPGCLGETL
jgi:hypothetical protein